MNPTLRNMLVLVGTVTLGGVGLSLYAPQPAARTTAELVDAGIRSGGQTLVEINSEVTTPQTRRRINRNQPGALRPKQQYATVARIAVCFGSKFLDGGYGNCLRVDGGVLAPFIEETVEYRYTTEDGGRTWLPTPVVPVLLTDGGVGALDADMRNDGGYFERVTDYPREPELIVPSLRRDLAGVDLDASVSDDDGGESDDVDDAFQFRPDAVQLLTCNQYDNAVDAGAMPNPFQNRFCGSLNRLVALDAPCRIPLCLGADGGWDDDAVVDCRGTGPYGEQDGGPRWRGCNATPTAHSAGSACVPVECGVVAGDDLVGEWK